MYIYIYIFIDVEFDSRHISRYITRNNIPKCLLESDFLASCSGTPFKSLYFPKIVRK